MEQQPIAPEHLTHVVERFYRVDPTRTPGQEKTSAGLGPAICQQIVEAHGGTIEVESELGDGTRFVVRLPLK